MFPGLVSKWEARHEQKYYNRKIEELITPVADKLTPESRQALEEKISAEAKTYGSKTVDSRLLCTGGFAMLPFQSAKQISDYSKNLAPHIDGFRDECAQLGMSGEQTEASLQKELGRQRDALRPGDKKGTNIIDGALDKPEFSPLGPAAKQDLPKWIVGRVVALGAAFSTQTIVDDRFTKPKDAVDQTLAKIVTRIAHPKGYNAGPIENGVFEEDKAKNNAPQGVDPKILDVVRMVTTDAYMTTVAIGVHMATMNTWDKKAPDVIGKIGALQEKLLGNKGAGPAV